MRYLLRVPPRTLPSILATLVLLLPAAACSDAVGPSSAVERDQLVFWAGSTTNQHGRPVYDLYRVSPDGSGLVKLTDQPNTLYRGAEVSRDGRTLLFGMDALGPCCTHLYSIGSDGTNLKRMDRGGGGYWGRYSPDGTRFAYHESDTLIFVGSIHGTDFVNVSKYLPPPPPTTCPSAQVILTLRGWVSTDRLMIRRYICGLGGSEYFVDLNDGSAIEVEYWWAQLSPDGTRLAVQETNPEATPGSFSGQVRVINLSDDADVALLHSVRLPDPSYDAPAWSANGRYVYTSPLRRIDLSSGKADVLEGSGTFQGLSSSGDKLTFMVRGDDGLLSIHVRAAVGTGSVKVTPSYPHMWGARWVRAR
jgi:hypothetical protein